MDQTVTDEKNDEKTPAERDKFEKDGLIKDLVRQREKNRALEERLSLIEASLNAPEQEPPRPVNERVEKLAQDPDAYIKEVMTPILAERLLPLEREFTRAQIDQKLDQAMEWIAEEEGISRRQAPKKYEKDLAEIVESHDLKNMDPYNGTIAAFKILQTEAKDKEEKEEKREKVIQGQHSETARSSASPSKKSWKTSEIASLNRSQYDKHREEILEAQREGRIIRDT